MRGAVAVLVLAAALVSASPARACKRALPTMHLSDERLKATDSQAPRFTAMPTVEIQPVEETQGMGCYEPGGSSCGDVGSLTITLPASDDQTPVEDVGFRLSVASGTPPADFHLPGHDVRAIAGRITLLWSGKGSLAFVLSVAPIDAAANLGEAVMVPVSFGEEGGCSVTTGAPPGLLPACLLLVFWAYRRGGIVRQRQPGPVRSGAACRSLRRTQDSLRVNAECVVRQ